MESHAITHMEGWAYKNDPIFSLKKIARLIWYIIPGILYLILDCVKVVK